MNKLNIIIQVVIIILILINIWDIIYEIKQNDSRKTTQSIFTLGILIIIETLSYFYLKI